LLPTPKLTGEQNEDEKPKFPIDQLAVLVTPLKLFMPSYEL